MADAVCGVKAFIDELDTEARVAVERDLGDGDVKTADIARGLAAAGLTMRANTVYRHRAGDCSCGKPVAVKPSTPDAPPHLALRRVEVDPDGADVETGTLEAPLVADDWDGVLLHFGLNPGEFQIVDDTVRMSSWQQSKRTDDGDRDTVTLYSYRARFARVTDRLPAADVDALVDRVRRWRPLARRTPGSGLGAPCTFYAGLADWQLGKSAGGGSDGTAQRALDAFEQCVARIKDLRRIGRNVTSVAMWNMGDPTEGCFAAETNVITDRGVRPIVELAAEGQATVKTDNGRWVTVPFRSFGVQPLRRVTLRRGGATKVLYATPNHRWLKLASRSRNVGRAEALTDGLAVGDLLPTVTGGGGTVSRVAPSPFGVAAGAVFGDGHVDGCGCSINLYRDSYELIPYFNGSPISDEVAPASARTDAGRFREVRNLPRHFKELPAFTESPGYLLGWLAGYIAADGNVGKTVSLSSANRSHLEYAAGVCAVLGIGTQPVAAYQRVGINGVEGTLYRLTLSLHTVPESLFVLEQHRLAFLRIKPTGSESSYVLQRNRARCWEVVSVEPTDRVEEVYCAQVPDTRSFVLANDLLTGNCDGNYASQLYTVELTRRQQLNLALDLWLVGIRTLAPLVDDLEFGSVLCNHGEWTRQGPGTKPVTSDSDNIGGYLGDVVRTVLDGRPGFDHVRFSIPHDDMTMSSTMSGVPVALAHGHKAPTGSKAELEWLRGQSLRLLRERGVEPRLWMTAHRHSYELKDYGPWVRIQHPSLDFGSKWYTDTSGIWSTPGTFTCLVGEHNEAGGTLDRSTATGFSDEMVLPV